MKASRIIALLCGLIEQEGDVDIGAPDLNGDVQDQVETDLFKIKNDGDRWIILGLSHYE